MPAPGTQLCPEAFGCCNCIPVIPRGVRVPRAEVLLPELLQVVLTLNGNLPSTAAKRRQELESGDGNLLLV